MPVNRITVDPQGWLNAGDLRLRCALGQNGILADKREGDKATPAGIFHPVRVFYRPDRRQNPPQNLLPVEDIRPDMGWCDDPDHPDYNQLIHLPHPARHEKLWRDDHVYDVIVALDHNTNPIRPGFGSAVFMHIAKPDYTGTEGCIALKLNDLLNLLRYCNVDTEIEIPTP